MPVTIELEPSQAGPGFVSPKTGAVLVWVSIEPDTPLWNCTFTFLSFSCCSVSALCGDAMARQVLAYLR